MAFAREGVDSVAASTAVGTSGSGNSSTVIDVGLAVRTSISRLAGASVARIGGGERVVGADATVQARVGGAVVNRGLALVASETVGAIAVEGSSISGRDIGCNTGGLETGSRALIASTTVDALVDRSAPNNTGTAGILVASGAGPTSVANALVSTGKVLAHTMHARVGTEGALIQIVAQAVSAANVAERAVAGRERSGSVERVVDAITRRNAVLAGLKVADSTAVNHGASRSAVPSTAVALSDEAAVGLGNIVASSSRVDAGAGVGKAGRGHLAGGTTVSTAKGGGAIACNRCAADRRGDAGSAVKARVVRLVSSGNGGTAGGLEGVAANASKAGVASADPVVLCQRGDSPGGASSACGVARVGVARVGSASAEATIRGGNDAAAGCRGSCASGINICAVVGDSDTGRVGVVAGSKHVVARVPGGDVGLEVR